ncbi:MAG: radical SAM protein [bacterium]|nr:radical SAM protein [bacterium]
MFNKVKIIKYGKIALGKLTGNLAGSIYFKTGFFMPRPTKLYYLVTNKCNFRCQMCPQWEKGGRENSADYVSEDRIMSIIKEMAKLRIFEFGISGGEPMIYKDKVLRLLKYANDHGLHSHFATNGSLLTEEFLKEYNDFGGGHVSLSLDAIGGKHDELRGYYGASAGVNQVINIFKTNNFTNLILKINVTLTNANLDEVMRILSLAKEAGAMAFVQPLDVYDYRCRNINDWVAKSPLWLKPANYGKLKNLIEELVNFKNNYPAVLLNSQRHLQSFYDYFTKDGFKTVCSAPLDQITIDPFGQVILCKFGQITSLRDSSLKDYIYSDKRKAIVQTALKCQQGCLLGCMYKTGLVDLIKSGPKQFLKLIK